MRPPRKVPTVSTTEGASKVDPGDGDYALHASALHEEVGGLLLKQGQVRLVLENRADRLPVELTVCLSPGGPYGRTLARVKRPKLDAGPVRGARHGTTERVDLAHEMALSDATDRRIAAHLPKRLDALREQERARAHTRGGQRGLLCRHDLPPMTITS